MNRTLEPTIATTMPSPPPDPAVPADSAPRQSWTTVIEPPRGAFDWRMGELLASRDLIGLFVWRDFIALYKQTILGPVWHVVQPILTALTYTVVFGVMVRVPTEGAPPFLFYLAGNVLWGFFSVCLTKTATTLLTNASLLGKVYFHRLVIPMAMVVSSALALGIQIALFAVVWGGYWVAGASLHPTSWLLAAPIAVLVLAGYGLGGGILVSAITTRYRDAGFLVSFGTQLLMFATPVLYPASVVPLSLRWVVWLNPLSAPLEVFRAGFLGGGSASLQHLAWSCALLPGLLVLALILFSRVDRTFTDTI